MSECVRDETAVLGILLPIKNPHLTFTVKIQSNVVVWFLRLNKASMQDLEEDILDPSLLSRFIEENTTLHTRRLIVSL